MARRAPVWRTRAFEGRERGAADVADRYGVGGQGAGPSGEAAELRAALLRMRRATGLPVAFGGCWATADRPGPCCASRS